MAAQHNKRKKTKFVVFYFLPIVFALISVFYIVFYTAPRLMDVNSLINCNYYYNSGTVEKIGFMKNYFVIEGKHYYLNPMRNNLKEGDSIRVKHTLYSNFTVEVTMIDDEDLVENANASNDT
jgi:hypothetical protein